MAIKDWHVGQLVFFWYVCGVWFFILVVWAQVGISAEFWIFFFLLGFAALPTALVVSWKWFGARNKPPGSSP